MISSLQEMFVYLQDPDAKKPDDWEDEEYYPDPEH